MANSTDKEIKELRIVTHIPSGVAVTLFLKNNTSTSRLKRFSNYYEAQAFVDGIKQGFALVKKGFSLDENS